MNKNIVLLLTVAGIIMVIGIGVFSYKYIYQNNQSSLDFINKNSNTDTANDGNPNNNTNNTGPGNDTSVELIQNDGLLVCSDMCGDGICQEESSCEGGSLNCICPEVQLECPQDCRR